MFCGGGDGVVIDVLAGRVGVSSRFFGSVDVERFIRFRFFCSNDLFRLLFRGLEM